MEISIHRKLLSFSFIILIINILTGYAVYKSNQQHLEAEQEVRLSEEVICKAAYIHSLSKDIVIASRGYVITGDSACLENAYAAKKTIYEYIDKLKLLTRHNPAQQQHIDSLNFYINKHLAFSMQAIELRNKNGLASSIDFISNKKGRQYNHRIVQVANSILLEEGDLLKQGKQNNERSVEFLELFTVLMFVLMTVFTILLLIATRHNFVQNKASEKREADLIAANKRLTFQDEQIAHRAAIVESSKNAIISISLDGTIKSWNRGAEKMMGFSAEEVLGNQISLIIPPANINSEKKMLEQLLNGEIIAHYETVQYKKSAEQFNVSLFIAPMKDQAGKIIGVSIIAHDITSRKKAEQEIIQKTEELLRTNKELAIQYEEKKKHAAALTIAKEKMEEKERLFLESQNIAHICSFATDLNTRTWIVSPEMYKIFGIDKTYPHTLEGWSALIHPDLRANLIEYHQEVETEKKRFDHEYKIIRFSDFEERWVHTLGELEYDEQMNPIRLLGTTQDITDRKNAELLLRQINEEKDKRTAELIKANIDLTTLSYVSSHDLQEPLRKIQNFVSLLLTEEEKKLSVTGKWYFKRIEATANRMQTLIEDLLTYSRTKTTERNFEKSKLKTILDEAKSSFEEIIVEKKATIQLINNCEIKVISFQFRQLFHNLISNSLKFSKPHLSPHVSISCKIEKGYILNSGQMNESSEDCSQRDVVQEKFSPDINYCHIVYTDNGIGFDPLYRVRIFEVFQRLHNYEKYKGTGMGLAICKRIIENHRGFITATGEPDKGARFDIYIPA